MSIGANLKAFYGLTLAPIRGATLAQRLESFYGRQAEAYDAVRRHMLFGRRELFRSLPVRDGGIWVDFGAGTGSNLTFSEDRISHLDRVYLVDLAPSLLAVAKRRIQDSGWSNAETVLANATEFVPPAGLADVVTFSYSLTMIPDWFKAVDHALRILKPGGVIGVCDFYVARKHPDIGMARHGWLTRAFWPLWFAFDNVHPGPDLLPYLRQRFATEQLVESNARMRFFPFFKTPYFQFVGRQAF